MVPGIVDLELIREELTSPKAMSPGTYRFGRLSHHSFFSRHHPHPQHVTHIQEAWKKELKELKELTSRVAVFTKETEQKSKEILELLCQILQTDSLSAIQYWLLYATPAEKDFALGLLQRAMSQLLPQPSTSNPAEKLLNQLNQVPEASQEKQPSSSSQFLKKMTTLPVPKTEKPDCMGKAQVLRVHS